MAYVSTESPTLGQGPKHFGAAPQGDGLQVQSPHRYSPRKTFFRIPLYLRGLYLVMKTFHDQVQSPREPS